MVTKYCHSKQERKIIKGRKDEKINRNNAAVNMHLSNGHYDGVKTGERQVADINSGPSEEKEEEEEEEGKKKKKKKKKKKNIIQFVDFTLQPRRMLMFSM